MEGIMRDKLRLNIPVNQITLETMAEGDVIVPDVKPDIGQVLLVEGMATVHKAEALKDRVNISGSVLFTVLYRPEEGNTVRSLRVTQPYYHTEELMGVRSDMDLRIKAGVDHAACTLIHSRKVSLKAIVSIEVCVTQEAEPQIVLDIEDDRVEKSFSTVKTQRHLGTLSETIPVRETLEVPSGRPAIGELLWTEAKIVGKDVKMMQNKVFIKGELALNCVYAGEMEDDGLCTLFNTLPFTEVFPIEGVTEDTDCEMYCMFSDFHADEAEDDEGDLRRISLDAVISVHLSMSSPVEMEILADAYHIEDELELSSVSLPIQGVEGGFAENITLKESLRLPDDAPFSEELLNAGGIPYLTDVSLENGRIRADGAVSVSYCVKSADSKTPVYSGKGEVPFVYTCDLGRTEESALPFVEVEILQQSVTLNGAKELEVKCSLAVRSKAVLQKSLDMITGVTLLERKTGGENLPSIMICYVRPGDSLWEIAKRYKTAKEEIVRLNDTVDFDSLKVGQQLFIPR